MKLNNDITWGDCSGSQFLKQDDIVPTSGRIVTIEGFDRKLIQSNGNEPDKQKVCVKFEEFEKWLVLNSTNGAALAEFTNTSTPGDSVGENIQIYVDPTVSFGGKIVGGIRFRPATEIQG